jgi:hypothetical protein
MSRERLFLIYRTCNRQAREGHGVLTKTYTATRFYTRNDMSQILGGVGNNEAQRVRGSWLAKMDGSCGVIGGSQGSAQL